MMIFKKHTLGLLMIATILVACNKPEKKTTPEGIEYYLLSTDNARTFENGDYGIFYLQILNEQDSIISDSKDLGLFPVKIDSTLVFTRGGLFSILLDLGAGDSVRSTLTASEVFRKGLRQAMPAGMELNDRMTIYASAKQNLDSAGFRDWANAMRAELMEKMQKEAQAQIEENKLKIKDYIAENNLKVDSTESGLYYSITEKGDGVIPENGQVVKVNYTGRLLNGKLFDTSVEQVAKENDMYNEQRTYGPIEFPLGQGQVIKGWDQGIGLLNVGSKATFIIPSDLAYGPRGTGPIPANAVLVFDVELVAVD